MKKKQEDMRLRLKSDKVKFYIGNVRDYDSINFATKGVDYVFHSAALKQVPSCEFFPIQAVKTNILGTENVLNAAINNKVKKVIVLSTNKAVYPINAIGASKAMMEKLMDTQISPPYPKSWPIGVPKKTFSEDNEKFARM